MPKVDPLDETQKEPKFSSKTGSDEGYRKRETSWPMVLFYIHLNILGFYGVYILFTHTSELTIIFTIILLLLGIMGATAGAHRLWAHNTFKASALLRFILMIGQTLSGQGSIYKWVQSHRLHHLKFGQPEDPFFSSKNFIYAHVRSHLLKFSPEQNELMAKIDMTDLESDSIVIFQKRFYWILYFFIHILLPVNTPLEYWGDSISSAVLVAFSLRYLIVSNVVYLINSAHFIWGLDNKFKPSDSNSIFFIKKSYWPRFHYLLPNDYKSDEFGSYDKGLGTISIRVFQALNWARDLRTISSSAVRNGLACALQVNKSIVECIQDEARIEMDESFKNHEHVTNIY